MAQGKAKRVLLGIQSLIGHAQAPDWSFIYEYSSIKAPKWNVGDVVETPDGREFHYAKSSGECASGQGAEFVATGAIPYTLLSANAAIGDKQLSFAASTHDAFAKDELRGGYCLTWPSAKTDQFRGIIGNDVSVENAAITVYLDGPLTVAVTTATYGECYNNPYLSLRTGSSASLGKAGVPAVYISGSGIYFWVQTGGIGWIAPQSDVDGRQVGAYYRHDGSLQGTDTALGATVAANNSSQYAGHRVIGSYSGNGPLFMLK